jgi:hypothetical protein
MIPALVLAATLLTAAPTGGGGGEPLPPGAPTDSYELAAWCYGALNEYLIVYEKVIPDLNDIDHMFGTSVVEDRPYKSDMAAAHVELKLIGESVTDAEKASPEPITERGLASIRKGQAIWSVAEAKTERELARAWLGWALPDRCDTNARELAQRSLLLGTALRYNTSDTPPASDTPPPGGAPPVATPPPGDTSAPKPAPAPDQQAPPADAVDTFMSQQGQAAGGDTSAAPPKSDQPPP